MPTAIHIHGALQAGQQPQAKTSKIANNRDIAFPTRKVRKNQIRTRNSQKHRPNTGIDTCKQAGEESCRKVTAKQQISQPSLPSKQPRNQATRQIGTCRQPGQQPTSETQEASKQCNIHTASQPAKQPSSQATSQQGSHPSSQPARQKQKPTKQKGREAHRDSNTHSQAGALVG